MKIDSVVVAAAAAAECGNSPIKTWAVAVWMAWWSDALVACQASFAFELEVYGSLLYVKSFVEIPSFLILIFFCNGPPARA